MTTDLTVGEPGKVLRNFCIPLLGSVVFQQLYNLADSFVAGKFIGENALAAVGNSYEITLIYLAFAFGCNMGCSVVVSQLFGAKDFRQVRTAVSTACLLTGAVCGMLMLVGLLGNRTLLQLIRTPEILMADSGLYLEIYTWGLPFLFFYNVSTGIFSALGDSRTPFRFLAVSSTANIGMDILFVKSFGMGVSGVAWATLLCQSISCLLAVVVVFRRLATLPQVGRVPLFSGALLQRILAVALPSTLQQSFVSIGNIVLQGVINGFGPAVIAGYAAGVKLNNLVITCLVTMGNGVTNFTAQNMGARKYQRIKAGFWSGLRLICVMCLPAFGLYFFCGRWMCGLFMDHPTPLALSTGVTFLRILSPFYFVVAAKLVADGVTRGAGKMGCFTVATFTDLLLRVGLAIVLSQTALGTTGIWCAWPIGWSVAAILSLTFVGLGVWLPKEFAEK